MRISDGSSDVCSSDLELVEHLVMPVVGIDRDDAAAERVEREEMQEMLGPHLQQQADPVAGSIAGGGIGCLERRNQFDGLPVAQRSEERRVGQECVSTGRSRWSPSHSKKQQKKT